MTDRIRNLQVTLDDDYRDDDVEEIENAIRLIRGVVAVKRGNAVTGEDRMNRAIAKRELMQEIYKLLGTDGEAKKQGG